MDITQRMMDDVLEVALDGRLDGYWADYLDRVLADALRAGHHRVVVDCDRLVFLSSAGIGILMKFHKQLGAISGGLRVVRPSAPVRATLKMTRLDALLSAPLPDDVSESGPAAAGRRFEQDGAEFDVYALGHVPPLTCRVVGDSKPVGAGARVDGAVTLERLTPALAIGVGAFGEAAAECRGRFGELVSVAGATAYQPADGTNVPDYLVSAGQLASSVHILGALSCEGAFSHLVRFDTLQPATSVGLSRIVNACFAATDAEAVGIVAVAEVAGLVGASLRRSPVDTIDREDFFAHPGVRSRIAFTAEPAFTRSVALIAGVAARPGRNAGHDRYLRPMGPDALAHLHAAAFQFRPITKGVIDLAATVTSLFEPDRLQGVLHLLFDDRGAAGSGESLCVRGACWVGALAEPWQTITSAA
jgi:anti-anti-sigma factor